MIKLEGRVLLIDNIEQPFNKIPKYCKLTVPEKVPITDGKIGIGVSYTINKMHKEGELDVIDETTLTDIGLTLAPVHEK